MLDGYKTYISVGALILWAVLGAALGKHDWNLAVTEIIAASAIIGLRKSIK